MMALDPVTQEDQNDIVLAPPLDLSSILGTSFGDIISVSNIEQLLASLAFTQSPNDNGMGIGVNASADAVGTDTFTSLDISLELETYSWGALALGHASLQALALGNADDALLAQTDCALDFSGADFILVINQSQYGSGAFGDSLWTASTTDVVFLAIDIAGLAPVNGPLVMEMDYNTAMCELPGLISGNLAQYNVDNVAQGDDSLVTVDVTNLAVEDRLSSTYATLAAAVDYERDCGCGDPGDGGDGGDGGDPGGGGDGGDGGDPGGGGDGGDGGDPGGGGDGGGDEGDPPGDTGGGDGGAFPVNPGVDPPADPGIPFEPGDGEPQGGSSDPTTAPGNGGTVDNGSGGGTSAGGGSGGNGTSGLPEAHFTGPSSWVWTDAFFTTFAARFCAAAHPELRLAGGDSSGPTAQDWSDAIARPDLHLIDVSFWS
ncbi:hypothetical protein [Xanthobacter sediminis]|uniref:hypothetical protein n=1 Tax=Xanthobacter sediminis TaxID=3119926 RepID=UPI003726E459